MVKLLLLGKKVKTSLQIYLQFLSNFASHSADSVMLSAKKSSQNQGFFKGVPLYEKSKISQNRGFFKGVPLYEKSKISQNQGFFKGVPLYEKSKISQNQGFFKGVPLYEKSKISQKRIYCKNDSKIAKNRLLKTDVRLAIRPLVMILEPKITYIL